MPPASVTLEAEYTGQRHTAELLVDGNVRYWGGVYRALSGAARAVKIAVSGRDTPEPTLATDGWDFWRIRDPKTGQLIKLKVLRRRLVPSA